MLSFDCNQAPVVLNDIVIPFIALQKFLVPFCKFSFGQQQFLLERSISASPQHSKRIILSLS